MNGIVFPRLGNNELVEVAGKRYVASFMNNGGYYTFRSVGEEVGELDWSRDMKRNEFDEMRIAKALENNKIKRL